MLIHIQNLLPPDVLAALQQRMEQAEFVDGRETAGSVAARVKQNLQLKEGSKDASDAGQMVLDALANRGPFCAAVHPKSILVPLFSRYEPGMKYGEHLDNPIMGGAARLRTDVSVTVFLNNAADYDGGELVIQTDAGVNAFRGNAGDAFAYPSNLFHQVNEVTRGVRLVAVTWVQSLIRDQAQRRILFDLSQSIEAVRGDQSHQAAVSLIEKSQMNLIRMWAEA